jgi:putative Mg2+ transporter-C (MgtC) family protein
MPLEPFDFGDAWRIALRLLLAFGLALPIGWNREREQRTLGLRSYPLVAITSAGFMLLGRSVFAGDLGAQARIIQGLVTGVGFLGGGAIVKKGVTVRGTATAASIWTTAAMGAATAYDRWEIALLLSLSTFAVLTLAQPFKDKAEEMKREEEEKDKEDD